MAPPMALGVGIGIPFAPMGTGSSPPPSNLTPALDFSSLATAQGQGTNSMYFFTGVI